MTASQNPLWKDGNGPHILPTPTARADSRKFLRFRILVDAEAQAQPAYGFRITFMRSPWRR